MKPMRIVLPIAALASMTFSAAGAPDEQLLGKKAGYPIGTPSNWFYDERVRVGSFSNLDKIVSHNALKRSASPLPLPHVTSEPKIDYWFNQIYTVDDFLARQRITGLLLIKDGQILIERYQYDRTAATHFVSNSMAKSIVSLAVGIALAEGKIGSLDDSVSKYEPKLAGSLYGETSIRNLLRMSSGVRFNETAEPNDDLQRFSNARYNQVGNIEALRAFKIRDAAQGTRFHYASSETVVLAVMLRAVTGGSLSEYLTKRLWQPMGAESDATWGRTLDGLESASGSFSATLRDYGRLGILLANDGALGDKQLVPKQYLLDATDPHRQPDAFAPGRAPSTTWGYGYQFWIFSGDKRRFALLGAYGQSIFVDPELKLVMVITAAGKYADSGKETLGGERDALWRGVIRQYGSW
jgi:CubicO group peptidase (beta-lactamase class C family)